jgi:hypothetical protein
LYYTSLGNFTIRTALKSYQTNKAQLYSLWLRSIQRFKNFISKALTMSEIKKESHISLKYVLATLAAVALTWLIHEFAHWFTGESLGNEMAMTLNTCNPVSGSYKEDWHKLIISAAGPIVTFAQALVIYILLQKNYSYLLLPSLLTCFYMRLVAGGISVINPNDEARISETLGLGTFTLPILISSILFYLAYQIVRKRKFTTKQITVAVLLIMLFSSIIILTDQALHIRIL